MNLLAEQVPHSSSELGTFHQTLPSLWLLFCLGNDGMVVAVSALLAVRAGGLGLDFVEAG